MAISPIMGFQFSRFIIPKAVPKRIGTAFLWVVLIFTPLSIFKNLKLFETKHAPFELFNPPKVPILNN
jgi:hypothetical protein